MNSSVKKVDGWHFGLLTKIEIKRGLTFLRGLPVLYDLLLAPLYPVFKNSQIQQLFPEWFLVQFAAFQLFPHVTPVHSLQTIICFKWNLKSGKREVCFSGSFQWPVFESGKPSSLGACSAQHPVPLPAVPDPCFSCSAFYTAAVIALCVSLSLKRLWAPRGQRLSCLYILIICHSTSSAQLMFT